PARLQTLLFDAILERLILAEQRYDPTSQDRQVRRRVLRSRTTAVLREIHIQHPVQPILNPPVAQNRFGQYLGVRGQAADEVAHLRFLFAPLRPRPRYATDRAQVLPLVPMAQRP